MLTRSQSTVNSSRRESTFYSKQLQKSLDARILKTSTNMAYYIIVESDFDKSKRQVKVIAEAAVRPSSLSINLSSDEKNVSCLLEKEIREHLTKRKSSVASLDTERYPAASYY